MRYSIILFFVFVTFFSCFNQDQSDSAEQVQGDSDSQSFWTATQLKDEFGDDIEGKTNTTATVNGTKDGQSVKVQLLNNPELFAITLFDPGSESFTQLPNEKFINVRVKRDSEEPYFIEFFVVNNLIADTKGRVDSVMSQTKGEAKFSIDLSRASRFHQGVYVFSMTPGDFYSEPSIE